MNALDRFSQRIDRGGPNGCWEWTGPIDPNGYGHFWVAGHFYLAHRFAYQAYKGEIGEGLTIDHLCRNRRCVNPAHLEAVDMRTNILRGDGLSARRARQTICKNGHPLSGANLYINAGRRLCRACRDEYRRAHQAQINARKAELRRAQGRHNRGEHNGMARLSDQQAAEILKLARSGTPQAELARRHNVSESTISRIVSRQTYRHVPEATA